jgi:RNase P subunit RPR2
MHRAWSGVVAIVRKCRNCGGLMLELLNVDRRERGGGRTIFICTQVGEQIRVPDGLKDDKLYTHVEIYCDNAVSELKNAYEKKLQGKSEAARDEFIKACEKALK